jgi:hypothetical protein
MATVEPLNEYTTPDGSYFTNGEGDLLILVNIKEEEYFVSVISAETFSREELYDLFPIGGGATFKVTI